MKKVVEMTVRIIFEDIENRDDLQKEMKGFDEMLRENGFGWTHSQGWGVRKWEEGYKK